MRSFLEFCDAEWSDPKGIVDRLVLEPRLPKVEDFLLDRSDFVDCTSTLLPEKKLLFDSPAPVSIREVPDKRLSVPELDNRREDGLLEREWVDESPCDT